MQHGEIGGASGLSSASSTSRCTPTRSKACTNCRHRWIKCDSARPVCNQCTLRPPRTRAACAYEDPRPPGSDERDLSNQMLETIHGLQNRMKQLESIVPPSRNATPVSMHEPDTSQSQNSAGNTSSLEASPHDLPEPPCHIVEKFIDIFLARFVDSGYFFLNPSTFQQSALLPLAFGHCHRPSPALLSAVYLWGSVLSPVQLGYPYTPDAFLLCALENLRHDISRIGDDSKLLLETIQAEILVSFYYLHSASPVQGCYHASGAASLALGAGLHSTCSLRHEQLPLCSLSDLQSTSRPATVTWGNAAHIDAFQAVLVINNCWVAVVGVPSTIPHWVSENWADRGTVQTGSTITAFLNGDDAPACSNVSLLVKASIFLERVVSFLTRTTTGPPPEPTVVASLNERIESFRAALPPLSEGRILLLTHALVDFAIVRLHAPYIHIVEQRRVKCLGAAARIVLGVGTVDLVDSACTIDPMLVSICTAVAHIYLDEIQVCGNESRRKPSETELETQLGSLMTVLASLSPYSSFYDHCFRQLRTAYAATVPKRQLQAPWPVGCNQDANLDSIPSSPTGIDCLYCDSSF